MGVGLSVVVQALLAISVYGIAVGLHPDHPSMVQHLVIVPVAMLVSTLPLTPGGVGLLEAAMVAMYAFFIEDPEAKGISLGNLYSAT